MPVRTKLLALTNVSTLDLDKTLYTAPSGRTAILKDVMIGNEAGAPTTVNLRLANSSGTERAYIFFGPIGGGAIVAVVERFIVVPEGFRILCSSTNSIVGQTRVALSGAELEGVA